MLEQYISYSEDDVIIKLPKELLIFAVLNSEYADRCGDDDETGEYDHDWIKITDKDMFVEDLIATLVVEAEGENSS